MTAGQGSSGPLLPQTREDLRRWRIGLSLAVFGAIGFSGKAILIKLAYRHGTDAVTFLMWRMLLALPLFMVLAWWSGRGKPRLSRKDMLSCVALGFCGYYLASFLDFLGLQYISASLERLILYLNPTIVLLMGWIVFGRKATRAQGWAMALGYAGVVIVFAQELSFVGSNVPLGATLVFASVVCYAVYLVYSGEVVKRIGAMRLTGWATSFACLFCVAQYAVLKPVAQAVASTPTAVLWLSLLNATLCTFVPVLAVMMAIERVGASITSQMGMIGAVATIAMGVVLLDEPFTLALLAGTVLVLSGMALLARSKA